MPPSFGDVRIDALVDVYGSYADRLSEYLSSIPDAEDKDKQMIYLVILGLLNELRGITRSWAEETLLQAYVEADQQSYEFLISSGIDFDGDYIPPDIRDIEFLMEELTETSDTALTSIQALAAQVKSGRVGLAALGLGAAVNFSALASAGLRSVIDQATMREQLRNGMVSILAKNGKQYRYSLDYYIGVAAGHAIYRTVSESVIHRSRMMNEDLVQISPNPSTIGDYCDEYRGRVFSISGMSLDYPPLSSTPQGGPPFHPHCHHTLVPFGAGGDPEEFGPVGPEFIALGGDPNAGPNEFQKLWKVKLQERLGGEVV